MKAAQGEALNCCIVISALVMGAVAVVIGIATRDGRSALVTGLCLLVVAVTSFLYAATGTSDVLGFYGMTSTLCTFAIFVLQTSRAETGNWWWRLAWFWTAALHGLLFLSIYDKWKQSLQDKIAILLTLLFAGVGLFFLVSFQR